MRCVLASNYPSWSRWSWTRHKTSDIKKRITYDCSSFLSSLECGKWLWRRAGVIAGACNGWLNFPAEMVTEIPCALSGQIEMWQFPGGWNDNVAIHWRLKCYWIIGVWNCDRPRADPDPTVMSMCTWLAGRCWLWHNIVVRQSLTFLHYHCVNHIP